MSRRRRLIQAQRRAEDRLADLRLRQLGIAAALAEPDSHQTAPDHCPRCESPDPARHPAVQADGGEVQVCPHPWHDPSPGHVRGCLRSWERPHAACPVNADVVG